MTIRFDRGDTPEEIADYVQREVTKMQKRADIKDRLIEEAKERYYEYTGVFTLTVYGTEASSRAKVEELLGNICDDFDINGVS